MAASTNPQIVAYSRIVGSIVAERRAQARYDQTTLGALVGMSQAALSRIEQGESPLPVELLARIAQNCRTTASEIMKEADDRAKQLTHAGRRVVLVRPKRRVGLAEAALGAAVTWGVLRAFRARDDEPE